MVKIGKGTMTRRVRGSELMWLTFPSHSPWRGVRADSVEECGSCLGVEPSPVGRGLSPQSGQSPTGMTPDQADLSKSSGGLLSS